MTTLNVKMRDSDKAIIQEAARNAGITASALMVNASLQAIRQGSLTVELGVAPSAALRNALDSPRSSDASFDTGTPEEAAAMGDYLNRLVNAD
ncbi:MAG: hypothetical protein LBH68_05120 [Bifidobacteriaceae bacterium]|jgi:uncharacterized protein (DUF1778 family)|nr:hypothetical protein [Bifidobacteriaceae bacterium]